MNTPLLGQALLPVYRTKNSEERHHFHFLLLHLAVTLSFCLGYGLVLYGVLGYQEAGYIMGCFTVGHLLLFAMAYFGASSWWIGNMFSLFSYLVVVGMIETSGGILSPVFGWFLATQVSAFWFSSRRSGYFWAVTTILTMLLFVQRQVAGFQPVSSVQGEAYLYFCISVYGGLLLYSLVVIGTYDRWNMQAKQQLSEQHDELLAAYEELQQYNEEIAAQREMLAAKSKELETSQQYMTASINYARRIQEAILGDHEQVAAQLGQAFFYWRPRDIVGGDFYWVGEQQDCKVIAVADCTGHGVPGALLTVLARDVLRRVVYEQGIVQPAQILQALDEQITKSLSQHNQSIEDGLDISILVQQGNTLLYAGAKHPLWYVREGQLHELAAGRYPIGGTYYRDKQFEQHLLSLQDGDLYYLFSDGYRDQYGGVGTRPHKYTKQRFRNLLLETASLPIGQQRTFLHDRLQEWMGYERQTDDILVFGLQVASEHTGA